MQLKKIADFLDRELDMSVPDTAKNGVQVWGKLEVKKIAFGVDASLELFEKAKEAGCDMAIVHHGLFWGDYEPLTGPHYERVRYLMNHRISLYAAHLPLDMHPVFGNSILLAKIVGLTEIEEFGDYHGTAIGFAGKTSTSVKQLAKSLDAALNTRCRILQFGPEKIESAAVASGRACSTLAEAIAKGYPCLVTGEAVHERYHAAKEGRISLITAGHYATETLGIKALMERVREKLKIAGTFIDLPTGF
ncbi:MAG: Nif3-like dinuclear metal center hexameric protein [archaeon]